jgi:hypothetical protein
MIFTVLVGYVWAVAATLHNSPTSNPAAHAMAFSFIVSSP